MANCSSCNGSCGGDSRTCVGALSTLYRTGCRYPYYTGPCPSAPCTDSCGNRCSNTCGCRANAQVTDVSGCGCNSCGCSSCSGCGTCGCNACNGCGRSAGGNTCGCNACSNYDNTYGCSARDSCGYAAGCHQNFCSGHAAFSANGPISLSAGGTVVFESHSPDCHYFTTNYGNILIRQPGLYYAAVTIHIPKHTEVDTVLRLELDCHTIAPSEIAVCTVCNDATACFSSQSVFHAGADSLLKLSTLREMCIDHSTAQPVFTLVLFRIH